MALPPAGTFSNPALTEDGFKLALEDQRNVIALALLATLVDAKGDLLVATAADTIGRLPVGTNGQILVADSAQPTGARWAAPTSGNIAVGTARLEYVSGTAVQLGRGVIPLKVGGAWLSRVSAGVSLSNASLASSTIYYVYAADSAGATVLEASTTTHAVDPDYGVEIKSGDPTRTLVGMVILLGGQFFSTPTKRFVRSWFRDVGVNGFNFKTFASPMTSAPFAELDATLRIEFLAWLNEGFLFGALGSFVVDTAGIVGQVQVRLDTGLGGLAAQHHLATVGQPAAVASSGSGTISPEGYHYVAFYASTSSNVLTFLGNYHGTTLLTAGRP